MIVFYIFYIDRQQKVFINNNRDLIEKEKKEKSKKKKSKKEKEKEEKRKKNQKRGKL